GERAGLYGPQGSGVSSMLELLFAVRQPTQGHLSFDGLDSRNWHLESLRGQVQLLRRDEFVDGTIVENLRLGRPDIAMEEVRRALEKVGMLDELLSRPEGLNLRLRIGGAPLSTSQRISLSIARALVQQPRLLLIDELFDGLDEQTLQRLTQLVLGGDLPWTVVVATRMQEVLACCDQKIELTKPRFQPEPQAPGPDLAVI
ncbi:MAG: ATP-binding cassette domain-containing protein, partial [Akkermansiaceae bacterium]|nr:ATP-binding cassette domain-containing protein [Akkermansiaceae bacterium]